MRRRVRGFTLIEVVVAFVLLALIMGVGFQIFSTGLARAGTLEERSGALEIARSQLAAAGIEAAFEEGQSQGQTDDGRWRWTTTVTRSDEGVDPQHPLPSPYSLYRVEVKVDWRGGDGRPQSLSLATLELGVRK